MKYLHGRKVFIFNFNVVFMYKIQHMYVFPASHFEVHAAIEPGRAREQNICHVYFALGDAYFALGGVFFLQLHALADENSMPW
jgi:hypothetical protein